MLLVVVVMFDSGTVDRSAHWVAKRVQVEAAKDGVQVGEQMPGAVREVADAVVLVGDVDRSKALSAGAARTVYSRIGMWVPVGRNTVNRPVAPLRVGGRDRR